MVLSDELQFLLDAMSGDPEGTARYLAIADVMEGEGDGARAAAVRQLAVKHPEPSRPPGSFVPLLWRWYRGVPGVPGQTPGYMDAAVIPPAVAVHLGRGVGPPRKNPADMGWLVVYEDRRGAFEDLALAAAFYARDRDSEQEGVACS